MAGLLQRLWRRVRSLFSRSGVPSLIEFEQYADGFIPSAQFNSASYQTLYEAAAWALTATSEHRTQSPWCAVEVEPVIKHFSRISVAV